MTTKYNATYTDKNGMLYHVTGTLAECANWADNIIRANGEGYVTVSKVEEQENIHDD